MDKQVLIYLLATVILALVQISLGLRITTNRQEAGSSESQDDLEKLWENHITTSVHNRRKSRQVQSVQKPEDIVFDTEDILEIDVTDKPILIKKSEQHVFLQRSLESPSTTEAAINALPFEPHGKMLYQTIGQIKASAGSGTGDPPSDPEEEADLGWGPWSMLAVGIAGILVALIMICKHHTRSIRHRRMSQFPMSFTNPVYEQALRDLRTHDEQEINHGTEAMDYFSSGASSSPTNALPDPWKEVSLGTPPVSSELDK